MILHTEPKKNQQGEINHYNIIMTLRNKKKIGTQHPPIPLEKLFDTLTHQKEITQTVFNDVVAEFCKQTYFNPNYITSLFTIAHLPK